jgi:hypothetical protein
VLDDLALRVNAEDIDACVLMIARPDLVTVQDHIVALAECALELDALARVLGCHAFEVIDEGLLAITDMRVVLDVGRAGVRGDGLSRMRLVKRPFQRCDSRVLTRQLDIETSEPSASNSSRSPSSTPANAIGCRRAAGREWLILPG